MDESKKKGEVEYYYKLKDPELRIKLRIQWKSLLKNKALKAQYKRAAVLSEIKSTTMVSQFKKLLPTWTTYEAVAAICGLLAIVKEDGYGSLGRKMAGKKGDKPICSEEKVRSLLSSNTMEDIFKNLRRILNIIKGDVDPISIISFIIEWEDEYRFTRNPNVGKSLKFKVYKEYYSQIN